MTFRRFALPQEYRGRHAVPGAGVLFCKSSDPSLTFRTSKSRAVSKWPSDTASRSLGLVEGVLGAVLLRDMLDVHQPSSEGHCCHVDGGHLSGQHRLKLPTPPGRRRRPGSCRPQTPTSIAPAREDARRRPPARPRPQRQDSNHALVGRRGAHLAAFDEADQNNLFGDPNIVGEDAAELHLDHMNSGRRDR